MSDAAVFLCYILRCCLGSISLKDTLMLIFYWLANGATEEVLQVDSRIGFSADLPCPALAPPPDDRVVAAFWYKDDKVIPFYTVDARTSPAFKEGRHRQLSVIGHRSKFNVTNIPPTLQLSVQTKDDEGVYVCRVDFHRSLTRMSTVVLHVLAPTPKITIFEGKRMLSGIIGPHKENSDLELICEMTGGDVISTQLKWFVDGNLQDESFKVLSTGIIRNNLKIKNLNRRLLMSELKCAATKENNATTRTIVTATVQLDLLLRPLDVRIMPREPCVRERKTIELWCTSRGSRPPADVTWWISNFPYGGNTTLEEEGNVTVSTILFSPLAEDHGKAVTCKSENRKIQDSILIDSVTLNVTYGPTVSLSLKTYSSNLVSEGDTVALLCQVKANPKVETVQWLFGKHPIVDARKHGAISRGFSLMLERLEPRHKGGYRCKASNSEGVKESTSLWLAVRHRPVCKIGQQVSYGAKWGETLDIRCEVDAEPSLVTFHWSFTNTNTRHRNLTFVSRGLRSTATYTATDNLHLGSLFCWANNSAGEQHVPCTFTVYLPASPNPPRYCHVSNATQGSIRLTCQPGYDGGASQHFFIWVKSTKNSRTTILNVTSHVPEFTLMGLSPGTNLYVTIVSINKMGGSEPVVLNVSTLKSDAQKAKKPWTFYFKRVLLIVSILTLVLLVASFLVFVAVRRNSHAGFL